MALEQSQDTGTFVSFKASIGALTTKSDKDDALAKPRTYIDQTTKEEKTVYERRFKSLSGKLVGIQVDTTGDYGTQIKLTIRDGEDYIFVVPLKQSWGTKIAEAIPNIDLEQEVFFNAYGDFTTSDGKEIKAGVSLKQNGETVKSAFNIYDEKTKTFKVEKGFPPAPKKEDYPDRKNKDKWAKFWDDYFYSVREFLEEYIAKNHTMEVVGTPISEADKQFEELGEDVNPEDFQF